MRSHLARSLGVVTAATVSLVALAAGPAIAAAKPNTVVVSSVDVWYSPGLHHTQAAHQTVYVSTPWVTVSRGEFECSTPNQGQLHMDVEWTSMWFYGNSVVPERLATGHGEFDDYSSLSLNGPVRVVYPTHTVIYPSGYADFYPIDDASYNRVTTYMQVHVPPTTVTVYAGNDTLTCSPVKADIDIAGVPTNVDSDNRVTSFSGPAVVHFS